MKTILVTLFITLVTLSGCVTKNSSAERLAQMRLERMGRHY